MSLLEASFFSPHLNDKFRLRAGSSEPVEAELIEVTEHEARSAAGPVAVERKPFSLVFRCRRDVMLPQGTYKVEHEKLGTLEIFLVPVGPDKEGLCYEAVFN